MGCDIHLFVEYKAKGPRWFSLTKAEFQLPRDYGLFNSLAGLRGDKQPLFAPKGFPSDVSEETLKGYYYVVGENPEWDYGWSYISEEYISNIGLIDYGDLKLSPDPDAHTPSWLTRHELTASLCHSGIDLLSLAPEYQIVFEALDKLEREQTYRDARIVFWFDN